MPENANQNTRSPGLPHAAVCFLGVVLLLALGLFRWSIELHSLMFLCLLWTGCNARLLGFDYGQIREQIGAAITRALPAIYIFILIGMIIASFMHSGTIAVLMYYGLDWLSPGLFLAMGMVLCAIMSLATGTSWGTVGTLGVVFIGIGETMGIPLPIVAGMIVCGATFGDKLSPISDTTNLAAMSAETTLNRHIFSMLYTTVPSFVLALLIFAVIGLGFTDQNLALGDIAAIRDALAERYRLSPVICLLPLVVLIVLSARRVAAEITMAASIVSAVLVAMFYQGTDVVEVLNALWANTPGTTGIDSLDNLLGRGGITSMSWTLILALLALALGGILHGAGFLHALLAGLVARIRHLPALIATTIGTGLLGNMAMGEAYVSIILNCQLFRPRYGELHADPALLSRSVEEGATLTTGLIPWTTAGTFYAATLGVPVLDYVAFAFFNYLNAVVSIAMATLGLGLLGYRHSRSHTH
jgi:NhaC family Na+:H+ antiporter